MRKKFAHCTEKKKLNTKENNNAGNEGQKGYKAYREQIAQ